ncbi:hypothetical protein TNCV_4892101 [Trichonephila clavipes]|nr:hypothetical protein TNCV_4892101 [Trichonephila clavipes]
MGPMHVKSVEAQMSSRWRFQAAQSRVVTPISELSCSVPTAELSCFSPTELNCFSPVMVLVFELRRRVESSCFIPAAELSCFLLLLI